MTLYDYLIAEYGYDEPIILSEIIFENYSISWIRKEINKLCHEDKLTMFENGIYYIPSQTMLGKSKLDYRKVINKKYIDNGKDVIGYYTGLSFMNSIGLTTQVPNVIDIYTNNAKSRCREIKVANRSVIIRRSRKTINKYNASVMQFLELMNKTDAEFYDAERKDIIKKYITENNITRALLSECVKAFPGKASQTLVESGLIYELA